MQKERKFNIRKDQLGEGALENNCLEVHPDGIDPRADSRRRHNRVLKPWMGGRQNDLIQDHNAPRNENDNYDHYSYAHRPIIATQLLRGL